MGLPSQPDIVIPKDANIIWNTHRSIRSNIIVESGGKLTIRCDVAMPKGSLITVQPDGALFIEGARIYNNYFLYEEEG